MVRVRFASNFFDMKIVACYIKRFAQLVDHNCGSATAHINAFEVISKVFEHEHFFTHAGKVRTSDFRAEGIAIEAAVGTQHLAKWHVHVQHIRATCLCRRHHNFIGEFKGELAICHTLYNSCQQALSEHTVLFRY